MAFKKRCFCTKSHASIHNDGSLLPEEVIVGIYCAECSTSVQFDPESMVKDNGWIIEYDMEIANGYAGKMGFVTGEVTPEIIFDNAFSSWNGYSPNDQEDKAIEKTELLSMASGDRKRYIEDFKSWTESRLKRLSDSGWRKARKAMDMALS
ncbi:MAG: hypothetical protein AAB014_00260 [Nitrospirota bacterium]